MKRDTKLFSIIVKYECIPKMFKIGVIIPIPKGDKDKTRQDNYSNLNTNIYLQTIQYRNNINACVC